MATYAARGSRKGPSLVIGRDIPNDVMMEARRAVFKAAWKWGICHVLLYPDGSITLLKEWRDHYRDDYFVGAYHRHFRMCDLREDLYYQMRCLLGDKAWSDERAELYDDGSDTPADEG